ncbi:carbohydrate deacetylase isoform X2 [Rhinolophus ferrumequinum]|uniref:carbohydrate deacetylase isoform X2 n=1 Tax=Rhinolophus ferrumequinum TaxID=59479 RepID=UPI00140F619E|nr:carbohydrate deacetylase isoform X2 [Rhinolophus ferrumequinum]
MAWPRVRLVVTADDFGYCPRRDEGIVEAFLAGAVTSVSLLVNGAAAESAAELARRHQIPTGLHANLSEGRPVGSARHGASSLLSPEGFFLGKMGFREAVAAGDVALPQVREELEAQLGRFRELLGRNPTHVDGHQHVHVLPGVCQVFAEVLQAHGVRFTRLPLERGVGGCTWLEAPARAFACSVERDARAAVGPFSGRGLRWTDAFVGLSTCGRHMSAHRVSGALARALEGTPTGHFLTAELMAHPGYPSVPPAGGCGPHDSEWQPELQQALLATGRSACDIWAWSLPSIWCPSHFHSSVEVGSWIPKWTWCCGCPVSGVHVAWMRRWREQMGKRVGSSPEHTSPALHWRLERQMSFLSHVSAYAQALMSPFYRSTSGSGIAGI